jgi:hypothetical protein
LKRRGGYTATGDLLGNAKPDYRSSIYEVVQIEATHDLRVFIDEHVEDADTGLLFGQKCSVSVGELRKEIVATIADRLGEVRPIRQFEIEDRCLVIDAKTLQIEHRSNVLGRGARALGR